MSDTDDQPTTDQDAGPPGDGMTGTPDHGPHPDPPPGEGQESDEEVDPVAEEFADFVDERSAESFPGSDPPATWAGTDDSTDQGSA